MKYTLNDYVPYLCDKCTRLEISPNNDISTKLIAEYKSHGAMIVSIYQLIGCENILKPGVIIEAINNRAKSSDKLTVFVGIEAYLAFLRNDEQNDFFRGLHNLLDKQQINAHFIISNGYIREHICIFKNPKYKDSMQIVYFEGPIADTKSLDIQLFPSRWVGSIIKMPVEVLERFVEVFKRLGNSIPEGKYLFAIDEQLPSSSSNHISIVKNANDALQKLYGIDATFDEKTVDLLLRECADENLSPIDLLTKRFGGEKNLTCDKAPIKLSSLKNDEIEMWELYVWLLKSKIKQDTYLYRVLEQRPKFDTFMKQYVGTARSLLGDIEADELAEERANVLRKSGIESLIGEFVSQTEGDDRSVVFLNCGTDVELGGLIRRAARLNITENLPAVFDKANPIINFYLSSHFDYGYKNITQYFHKLRHLKLKDSIDESFVKEAYEADVPKEIEERDLILNKCDDGETALLIVDGMGAEYYPLLIKISNHHHLKIEQKKIVTVNLPTSTEFNKVSWSAEHRLQDVKQIDNISHVGHSKCEKCKYEDNLAETLILFEEVILDRVREGLRTYKRVVVTADHGSSHLALTAYRNKLTRTIEWDKPNDWRYASSNSDKGVLDGLIREYDPERDIYYYVIKGYNRLSKQGPKFYGLHGGATLEERLVPFVVFTNESVQEIKEQNPKDKEQNPKEQEIEQEIEQFTENKDFDIL